MNNSNKGIIYSFENYQVHPQQRKVWLGKFQQNIPISKKSFDILLLLLEKKGQVLSKQEIMSEVWPNQIVTEAALSKQIARLRKDLQPEEKPDKSFIETVRGVGIRLSPLVTIRATNNPVKSVNPIVLVLLTLLLIGLGAGLISNQTKTTSQSLKNKPINMAIIPAEKIEGWLNIGGLNYLSENLQKHPDIQTINPQQNWFKSDQTQSIAIEMVQNQRIDYTLSVKNSKQTDKQEGKQGDKQGTRFFSEITLRSKAGVFAKETLSAENLSLLFERIESWVIRQLKITHSSGKINDYTPTEFALTSYLKGLEVAKNKSYTQAVQFLQASTTDDPGFIAAWMLLADVESLLGHYNKSLALIETLENNKQLNDSLISQLYLIKANVLVYLNKIEQAQIVLKQLRMSSEKTGNKVPLIKSLTTEVVIDFNTNQVSEKTIETLKKQLRLLKDYNPDPYYIALSSLNLAAAYQNLGQPQQAIKHVELAIDMYNRSHTIAGIVSSYSILARIYNGLAENAKALSTLNKAETYAKSMDSYKTKLIYLNIKIEAQIYLGLHAQAKQNINKLIDLSLSNDDLEPLVIALTLHAELNILVKDYKKARVNISQLKKAIKEQPKSYPPAYDDLIVIYDLYIAAFIMPIKEVRRKQTAILKERPQLSTTYDKELRLIKAELLKRQGLSNQAVKIYQQLVQDYIKENRIQNALQAGFSILDIQWHNDREAFITSMNYFSEISSFNYPLQKYQAQYQASINKPIYAYTLMKELKTKAKQFWTTKDQLLLEKYQLATR